MSSTNETKKPNGAAEPAAEAQSAPADTAPAAEPNAEDTATKADKDAKPEKDK